MSASSCSRDPLRLSVKPYLGTIYKLWLRERHPKERRHQHIHASAPLYSLQHILEINISIITEVSANEAAFTSMKNQNTWNSGSVNSDTERGANSDTERGASCSFLVKRIKPRILLLVISYIRRFRHKGEIFKERKNY